MSQYNPNDFYPRTGAEIDSNGNLRNDADGLNSDGSKNVQIIKRKTTTIQTHTNVSITSGATNTQTNWMNCDGFDNISVTFLNDAATNSTIYVYWSNDGVNVHGTETLLASASTQWRKGTTPVGASYAKVAIMNTDSATHVVNAWAYFKA